MSKVNKKCPYSYADKDKITVRAQNLVMQITHFEKWNMLIYQVAHGTAQHSTSQFKHTIRRSPAKWMLTKQRHQLHLPTRSRKGTQILREANIDQTYYLNEFLMSLFFSEVYSATKLPQTLGWGRIETNAACRQKEKAVPLVLSKSKLVLRPVSSRSHNDQL